MTTATKTEKRTRGRPPVADKRISLRVPVTESERQRLQARATLRGLDLATWCRMTLLDNSR